MRTSIKDILTLAIREQDPFLESPVDLSAGDEAALYGPFGQIDSLALVTIMADVERHLHARMGVKLRLASDADLDLRNSPFLTFGTAVSFIEKQLDATRSRIQEAS